MVDVKPIERLENIVTLQDVKEKPELSSMALIKRGQRLSIQRVTLDEYEIIREMGGLPESQIFFFFKIKQPLLLYAVYIQ